MTKLTIKPTTRDAIESIWCDYLYPSTNTIINITDWITSQDIQNELSIFFMELADLYVESVPKSDGLPFDFDKTLEGTTLKKVNRLGESFYNLLMQQNEIAVNPGQGNPNSFPATFKILNCDRWLDEYKYEVSENMKILYAVASDLNLHGVIFTGNPLSKMSADGLLEGELINSFVTRLREATKRKSFKTKVAQRKIESAQSFTKSKRYLDRLHANNPGLYGVRMVNYYRSDYANMITLEESADHLMKFFEPFEPASAKGQPVGWWWKREYMTEMGYRYYLIFFFDGQEPSIKSMDIQDMCGHHWCSVTKDRGAYFIPPILERDYQRCLTGLQQQGYGDNLVLIELIIQRMFMRDNFLRLKRNQKCDHFGLGKLPKLKNDTPPNNCFTQPR